MTGVLFGLTHFSRVILSASVAEWLLGVLLMLPIAIGLAAVTFRLDSLWPLIVWHFIADVPLIMMLGTESATYVLAYLGLTLVIGAMGLWLLLQDQRAGRRADQQRVPGGA
ncbi:hypothetical protein SAMN05216226_112114 [Halovenus aranensis]|uniref:CAAX prenyl protease 2/Lysostaphin resistance protein A-like domain-containing protein n=1 Tax=Halovenus aranensis TaxID=890420 RepID=A0A1G8XXI3_9EURY|nr:hypothetical protein SAMN05216226_112114 [Halovenus aranensis]